MFVSYILNLAWLLIMSVGVVPIIGYLMLRSICNTEVYSKDATSLTNYCFSLTSFGKINSWIQEHCTTHMKD